MRVNPNALFSRLEKRSIDRVADSDWGDTLNDTRRFAIGIALVAVAVGRFCNLERFLKPSPPVKHQITNVTPKIHEPLCIEMTGSNYRWQVRYHNADGCVATDDDVLTVRNVYVPLETEIILLLRSRDFVYLLTLPEFGLKEIAVPDLEFRMTFRPPAVGRFAMDGDELCGDPHPELRGQLIVQSRNDFLAWLDEQRKNIPEGKQF